MSEGSSVPSAGPAAGSPDPTRATAPRRPRLRRVAWIVLITLTVLSGAIAAALRWWLPDWSRQQAEAALRDMLGTPVHVGQVSLALFDRRVGVSDLRIGPDDRPLLRVGSAEVQLATESLWRRIPVVERVQVRDPELWIHRSAEGTHNFTPVLDHLAAWQARQPASPPQTEPARYALHNLRLSGGRIHHTDERLDQRHEVQALEIGIPFLSNLPSDVKVDVQPTLAATVDGSVLRLGGHTRPFAPDRPADLTLKWEQADLKPWATALETVLASALPLDLKDGRLDADLRVRFAQAPDPQTPPHLQISGALTLQGLDAHLPGQALDLRWTELRLQGLDLQPLRQRYALEGVHARGLDALHVLGAPKSDAARATPSSRPAPAQPPASEAPASGPRTEPVRWTIATVACEDCRVAVRDDTHRPATTVTLQQAGLKLGPLSDDLSQPQQVHLEGQLSSAVGTTASAPGTVALDAQLRVDPLTLLGTVALKGVDLRVAQPYLAPHVNLVLAQGRLSTQGRLDLRRAPATGAAAVDYQGRLTVNDLRTLDSVNGAEFVAWQSLDLQGMKVALRHNGDDVAADLGRVGLDGLQARLILNPDGRLNVADVTKSDRRAQPQSITTPKPAATSPAEPAPAAPPPPQAAPAATSPPMDLKWQEIRLQRGTIAFSDHFIKPNYSARLTKLQGTLSALSARAPQPAQLTVAGALDDGAPLRISGTVHPLGARLYTDIEASARGIALPRLSTYAARYAGYGIDKGSMSVTLRYRINDGKLEAENQVFLDQLTFGEKVDSPTATQLPVLLAVSLLKNRRGEIDLHLPISGTLDDPKFSVGGIIWKMVLNIIGKAVTAPFSLLMGGGSAEDGRIAFAPGSAELTPATRQRLDDLAHRLADRPQLKLEVTGSADPALDGPPPAPAPAASTASAPARARNGASHSSSKAPAPWTPAQFQALADERAMRVMAYLSERLPAERVVLNRARVEAATPSASAASAPEPVAAGASAPSPAPAEVTGVNFQLR